MIDLQNALDQFSTAEENLLAVVSAMFPPESVARCEQHSNQFAIVVGHYKHDPPGSVRCLLESDGIVEWPAYTLTPMAKRAEWPTWVKKRLASRKSQRTRRLKEYGRVTGELR